MVIYAAFKIMSVISRQQLTYHCIFWLSLVPAWSPKCLAQQHSYEMVDCLICVFRRFQHYFSHTTVTAHISLYFLAFTSTRFGLTGILPKDTPTKNLEDPVGLKPLTSGYKSYAFTSEPRRTPDKRS